MVKLEKLPPDVEAALPAIRDEWIAIGLSTEPANRPVAEEGVRLAYQAANLEPPTEFRWADSPWEGCRLAAQLAHDTKKPTKQQIKEQAAQACYGQHDAGWLGFYDVFSRTEIAETVAPLKGLMQVARNAGWWWAYPGVAILTDRPAELHRDAANRLHREDGPALRYRDGWSLYCWHGLRIERWIIEEPETITAKKINAEQNQEIRRAMIERIGWLKYLELADAKELQRDDYGILYDLPPLPGDEERVRLVRVTNDTPEPDGTYKDYILRVPPTQETARGAVAWTFGVAAPEGYAPAIET